MTNSRFKRAKGFALAKALIVAFLSIVLLGTSTTGCSCNKNRKKVVHREVITETLKDYIKALEEANKDRLVGLIVKDQQELFARNIEDATRDDLISLAIDFVSKEYFLQDLDKKLAIFWSNTSKEYLALSFENKRWLINPQITDEMNAD